MFCNVCIAGFVPRSDILDLVCRISYNYCYLYVLNKMTASSHRQLDSGCKTAAFRHLHWQLDDVVKYLSEMSE